MLKMLPKNRFANIKCGEIYWLTTKKFRVSCFFCCIKIELEGFASHFKEQHLELQKESQIAVVENEPKRQEKMVPTVGAYEAEYSLTDLDEIKEEYLEYIDEKPIDFMELQSAHIAAALPIMEEIVIAPKEEMIFSTNEKDFADGNVSPIISPPAASPTSEKSYKADDEDNFIFEALDDFDWQDSDDDKSDLSEFNPFPCTLCDKGFPTKRRMQDHVRKVHKRKETAENESESPKINRKRTKTEWKCDECNEVFRAERNLIAHKKRHTGFPCDICGKQFKVMAGMQAHRVRHSGIKDHKCKECEMAFFTKTELSAHMWKHSDSRTHICEVCGRKCRDSGFLKLHMRRHTGERPFKCKVCGKCFFSGNDLNIHSVTHTSIRPFVCDICGSSYKLKKTLRIHKRKHLEVPYLRCEFCNKGFTIASALRAHMRNVHVAEQTGEV